MWSQIKFQTTRTIISSRSKVPGGGVGGWVVAIIMSNPTQLSYVEVVLRLIWGCDNFRNMDQDTDIMDQFL